MVIGNPFPLKQNSGKSFQGNIVLGTGFVLTVEEAQALIIKDPRNKDILFPYLNGDDLNNDPEQKPSRWVINFFDWSEEKARLYPDCFDIVERLVKPEREAYDESKNSWNKSVKAKWWLYGAWRKNLEATISKLDQVMVINRYTKYLVLDFQLKKMVFSDSIVVITLDSYYHFSILSSSIHEIWAWKNSSTMGSSTLRYSPTNAFETFPFPAALSKNIEDIGVSLDKLRKSIMSKGGIGITELYNLFHDHNLSVSDTLGADILALRTLHSDLDNAVLELYGRKDILLKHNFYEMEYLPEKDRLRFTIHPDARREILKHLLLLNHKQHKAQLNSLETTKKVSKKVTEIGLFSDLEEN